MGSNIVLVCMMLYAEIMRCFCTLKLCKVTCLPGVYIGLIPGKCALDN